MTWSAALVVDDVILPSQDQELVRLHFRDKTLTGAVTVSACLG